MAPADLHTTLRFVPDCSILSETTIAPAFLGSYFRRLSLLWPGTRFTLVTREGTQEYYAECGVRDLFAAVSAPYQLLHELIDIRAEEGSTKFEAVLAYHSWTDIRLCSFINHGRAEEGGTHEQGFFDAVSRLDERLQLSKNRGPYKNGVIGVLSVRCPKIEWASATRTKIGNPELREMVRDRVVEHTVEWMRCRPDIAERLRRTGPFQFPWLPLNTNPHS